MKRILAAVMLAVLSTVAHGDARIAVASNFENTARTLADAFFEKTGERITLVAGGNTSLARQVREGAGFDAFMAGDVAHAREVVEDGAGIEEMLFVYGTGRLVLMADDSADKDPETMLRKEDYRALAIPDDRASAYGAAAMQVLDEIFRSRFAVRDTVDASTAAQAFQFMRSGSVDLGFVPLSVVKEEGIDESRWWLVPQAMHDPLEQAAVMLEDGSGTASDFLNFVREDEKAHRIMRESGYTLPADDE